MNNFKRWTDEEDKLLSDYIEKRYKLDKICEKLDRSTDAVRARMYKLGLYSKQSKAHWRPADKEQFKDDWQNGKLSLVGMARKYNRTTVQLQAAATRFGFGRRELEIDRLSISQVAEYMGVNKSTISRWIHNAGLKTHKTHLDHITYTITTKDLLKWMKDNPNRYNASKIDSCLFFEEPDWLLKKRETDKVAYHKNFKRKWTPLEESKLKGLLRIGKDLDFIAKELGRSKIAIQRKMEDPEISKLRQYKVDWTNKEEQFIIENYDKISKEDMIKHFPTRTEAAIMGKIRLLKKAGRIDAEIQPHIIWTEEDKNKVILGYNNNKTSKEIAKEVGRSTTSVQHCIKALKKQGLITTSKVGDIETWTEEEVNIILNNYSNYSTDELCKMLPNRSKTSIVCKIKRLEESGKLEYKIKRWTKEEDTILISNYPELGSNELSKLFKDKTQVAVCKRLSYLRRKGLIDN